MDTEVCEPGGQQGNYIMYRNAVSGEDPNNDKFSPCSKERILPKVAPLRVIPLLRVIQIKKHDSS